LPIFITTGAATAGLAPTFRGIGDLPGGSFYSEIRGLSPDGTWVVGETNGPDGYVAFHMAVDGGIVTPLPGLPGGGVTATAEDVSDTGIIAGYGYPTTPGLYVAYRAATAGGSPQPLGYLDGGQFSRAFATSRDGQILVGDVETATGLQAFRWTAAGGMEPLGDLPGGGILSEAMGISGDGSTIVGFSETGTAMNEAFRWTRQGGMTGLGNLAGGTSSAAYAASDDGRVIVGISSSPAYTRAFRWSASTGMIDLGVPAGLDYSTALDVSDDGRVITGFAGVSGTSVVHAFVSLDGGPARTVEDVIRNDYHLPIAGWTLEEAFVNGDATVFAGFGIDPEGHTEGWIFQVPEPTSLALIVPAAVPLLRRRRV
jgi:probable HAF family extracellular repeat protein